MSQSANPSLTVKRKELEELRSRVRQLESEIAREEVGEDWQPTGFYATYYAITGGMLGMLAAIVSLLSNVVFAPVAGKDSLELIRVYLTFPLGEEALQLASGGQTYAVGDGIILTFGCCLYIATGMLLGIPIYLVLVSVTAKSSLIVRAIVASALGLLIWLINFYGILSWLQPVLCGGNWITDQSILPWWVAAATHVIFGCTMALVYPLGTFTPYRHPTESSSLQTTVVSN